jgi:hypothetical protein
MINNCNVVSLSPSIPLSPHLHPDIEAYIDEIFREPEGFGHESADENEFDWSPCVDTSNYSRETTVVHSNTDSSCSDCSSTPSGVWVPTPGAGSVFVGSYEPYYDDCIGRIDQETSSSSSWFQRLKTR